METVQETFLPIVNNVRDTQKQIVGRISSMIGDIESRHPENDHNSTNPRNNAEYVYKDSFKIPYRYILLNDYVRFLDDDYPMTESVLDTVKYIVEGNIKNRTDDYELSWEVYECLLSKYGRSHEPKFQIKPVFPMKQPSIQICDLPFPPSSFYSLVTPLVLSENFESKLHHFHHLCEHLILI